MANVEHMTGTRDVNYNLISVLYHTLQGAETYLQYIADAERAGDQELMQFFRHAQEENRRLADQAKQLLRQRLGQEAGVTTVRT
jgi:rubrerythrin